MTTTTTEVRYYAKRDSMVAKTDYDSAMCHADIYAGDSFEAARDALVAYIEDEAQYAMRNEFRYTRASSLRRAADLLDAAEAARNITGLPTNKAWTKGGVAAGNVEYTLIRVERTAK